MTTTVKQELAKYTTKKDIVTEANRNMVKFIKIGDNQKAIMWAERLEQLEKEIELI